MSRKLYMPMSRRCWMNLAWMFEWCFNDFGSALGSQIDKRSVLGSLLRPRPIFGGQKAFACTRFGKPSWGLFEPKSASCGVSEPHRTVLRRPEAIFNPFFPSKVSSLFRTSFCINLGPQNDSKIIQQQIKNPCPQEIGKKAYFDVSCIESLRSVSYTHLTLPTKA